MEDGFRRIKRWPRTTGQATGLKRRHHDKPSPPRLIFYGSNSELVRLRRDERVIVQHVSITFRNPTSRLLPGYGGARCIASFTGVARSLSSRDFRSRALKGLQCLITMVQQMDYRLTKNSHKKRLPPCIRSDAAASG